MPDTTYSVFRQNGTEFSLTIPDNYKLTFGPTVPGIPRDPYRGRTAWCLRIYGPGKRLLAVYPDVTNFQDNNIQTEFIERNEQGIIINRYPNAIQLDRQLQQPTQQSRRRSTTWADLNLEYGVTENGQGTDSV